MEIHGGSERDNIIDFSISVNPYTPTWKDELFKLCEKMSYKYTYTEWIERDFQSLFGKNAVILAGATEALQIIGFTIMDGASVVIPSPSYGEYERVAKFRALKIVKIPPKNNFVLDLEGAFEIAERLSNTNKTVLIFGNPTNPLGSYAPKQVRDWIYEVSCKGVIVVIDEAFIDFVKEPYTIKAPGVVRLRTFTKSYGMPGIRVGYVLTDEFKETFERYRAPWAIGACGYAFLKLLLKDKGNFLKRSIPQIWEESKRFRSIGVFTDANFGCLKVENAIRFQNLLDAKRIHVRNCESFGMDDYVRISIRTPKENDKLFEAFQKMQLP